MNIAFVSIEIEGFDAQTGGIATFISQFSILLRQAGHSITLIFIGQADKSLRPERALFYQQLGIDLVQVHLPRTEVPIWPHSYFYRLSEQVTAVISSMDVIYFHDYANPGFDLLRRSRFNTNRKPVCVTVLHGSSMWVQIGNSGYPTEEDLIVEYMERYGAEHSDFVASPSQYMLNWATQRCWKLPPADHVFQLGLPMLPRTDSARLPFLPGAAFRRLVFFGRLETRKGFETFIMALERLHSTAPEALRSISEVVFLGAEASNQIGGFGGAWWRLHALGLPAVHLNNLDSGEAQAWLAEHASDSLVVIAGVADNFPYTAVEASNIPGLNILCARGGGIPEILGAQGVDQLFDPNPVALAERLRLTLQTGPRPHDGLVHYDFRAANRAWLDFNERACALAYERAIQPPITVDMTAARIQPSVDVCIPYFNQPDYLPQTLRSFELQTCQDFSVIVMDDGSDTPEALKVFAEMEQKYTPHGWRFYHQENQFVDAARNAAARHSTAEYLIFFDGDDVAAPTLIEHFLRGIRLTGDDALMCGQARFTGKQSPIDWQTGALTMKPDNLTYPLGPALMAGLTDPGVFGTAILIVRRSAFEAIGGYTLWRGVAHEDFELFLRLSLAGYTIDLIPEPLQLYRNVEASVSKTTPPALDKQRVLRVYEDYLLKLNLSGLAEAYFGMKQREKKLWRRAWDLEWKLMRKDR